MNMDRETEIHFRNLMAKDKKTIKMGNMEFELGKVYSNPFAKAFKSPEQIESEKNNNKENKEDVR